MKNIVENTGKVRRLELTDDQLQFSFINDGSEEHVTAIQAGTGYLPAAFFTSEYPNDREMERALEHIEDQLTVVKGLRNHREHLVCKNSVLAEMLYIKESQKVDRNTIEMFFDKYVNCAYGESAKLLGIDYSQERLTVIMLVRSVMYYLDFDQLEISC